MKEKGKEGEVELFFRLGSVSPGFIGPLIQIKKTVTGRHEPLYFDNKTYLKFQGFMILMK